ncbi:MULTISPECIES: winged helix-turn-helix transcriptional regulator [unclassified Streptomyces]|uniref:winged helix-turn-helix transcriptional regulator n=1 Tax=unclassified Streptomyces TaxID=2593676 RepID=UPI002B1DC456|nr:MULTISPECIES: winged helix-turn-helix transcriptional regulator [unclassified Streptomyces]
MPVVRNLRHGPRRFTELKRAIDEISQRMLAVTLLEWSARHLAHIDTARAAYDARPDNPPT